MKCPKCGYNSFEVNDTCKKCANDLTGYKETHGLKSIVFPQEARTSMAQKLMADMGGEEQAAAVEAPADDMFSFDSPAATPAAPAPSDDPFNFDDEPAVPAGGDFSFGDEQKSAQAKAEEEAFAGLLETSPQVAKTDAPAAAKSSIDDLSNFSWDDTPEDTSGGSANTADDFNSLFGDEDAKK